MKRTRRIHTPSDIHYKYGVKKLEKIRDVWKVSSDDSGLSDLLFLLALLGVKHNNRIPLSTSDGQGEATFSRVVYQKHVVKMEAMIGLISILGNPEKDYKKLLNEIAFATMDNYDLRYVELPNILDFYEYVLGGIDPMYSILFDIGDNINDIASSIYDNAIDGDQTILEQLSIDILEGLHE